MPEQFYLSDKIRPKALRIYSSLQKAVQLIRDKERSAAAIKEEILNILEEDNDFRIDYVEIVDGDNLNSVEKVGDNTLIAIAAFVDKVRLIDNVLIDNVN